MNDGKTGWAGAAEYVQEQWERLCKEFMRAMGSDYTKELGSNVLKGAQATFVVAVVAGGAVGYDHWQHHVTLENQKEAAHETAMFVQQMQLAEKLDEGLEGADGRTALEFQARKGNGRKGAGLAGEPAPGD